MTQQVTPANVPFKPTQCGRTPAATRSTFLHILGILICVRARNACERVCAYAVRRRTARTNARWASKTHTVPAAQRDGSTGAGGRGVSKQGLEASHRALLARHRA